jgi:hypothetical protein
MNSRLPLCYFFQDIQVPAVTALLIQALREAASDIHIEPFQQVHQDSFDACFDTAVKLEFAEHIDSTKESTGGSMNKFDMAKQIRDAACYLDSLKNRELPTLRPIATIHVNNLHNAAQLLACERVNEIYAPDDCSNGNDIDASEEVSHP